MAMMDRYLIRQAARPQGNPHRRWTCADRKHRPRWDRPGRRQFRGLAGASGGWLAALAADSPRPPPTTYGHLVTSQHSEPVIRVMAAPETSRLQPADDELKIGPEVMPVNIATPSDGTGRENARRPVLRGLGELGACPPGHASSVDLGCLLHRAACGLVLSVASSGKGQCNRQGLVHAAHGGR